MDKQFTEQKCEDIVFAIIADKLTDDRRAKEGNGAPRVSAQAVKTNRSRTLNELGGDSLDHALIVDGIVDTLGVLYDDERNAQKIKGSLSPDKYVELAVAELREQGRLQSPTSLVEGQPVQGQAKKSVT